jgi:oxygen-independent coproporphyrinogen-3 oxidase
MEKALRAVADAFEVVPSVETTIEANPGDLNGPALTRLLEVGVNRLSIGVQSLDDSLLSMLGRRHTAQEAIEGYRLARNAGFESVNLDLMYGLPRQAMAQWEDTMEKVLELDPPHLSLYCLTLEEGTPMERWVHQGRLPEPDPDLAADMYTSAREALGRAGYHHYEISNWAMPGFQSRHNLAYWLNRSYLGMGPGAHSCLHGHRFWDVASPRTYIRRVYSWGSDDMKPVDTLDRDTLLRIGPVDGVEAIGPRLEMAETMFLGLRLLDGLSMEDFKRRFGHDPMHLYRPQIGELEEEGLLERSDGVLRLTEKGCLLANQVFMRFLD